MAVVVREVLNSRSTDAQKNLRKGRREFIVYDTSTPITSPKTVIDLYGTATTPSALPINGQPFPDLPALIGVDDQIMLEPGHKDMWRVRWDYDTISPGGSTKNPQEIGYVEFTFTQGREFQDAWRKNPTNVPTAGDPIINASGWYPDVGGESVDQGGQPGSAIRFQQVLQITEVVEAVAPPFASYGAAVGRRNINAFYGAPKGKVVMLPVASARIGIAKFNVNFSFAWDEFYHMQQAPRRGPGGIVLYKGGTGPQAFTAEHVYWIQPFEGFFDFNTLSDKW